MVSRADGRRTKMVGPDSGVFTEIDDGVGRVKMISNPN